MPLTSSTNYPSSVSARWAQVVLVLFAVISAMDQQVGKLLIEPIRAEFSLNDAEAGFANVTVTSILYAICALPAGLLTDRVSRVGLLIVASVIWVGALALMSCSQGLGLFLVGKGALGVSAALMYPAALSLFSDFFPPERRAGATTTYPVGQTLGGAAAVLVGGLAYSFLSGVEADAPGSLMGLAPWRAVFLVFCIASAVLIPTILTLREPARQERGDLERGTFSELWRYRVFLIPLFLGIMFLNGVGSGVMIWIYPALMRLYGLQPGDFAVWMSALGLASGLAGLALSAWLVERGRRRSPAAMILPAIAGACFCGVGSLMAVMPTFFLFGVLAVVLTIAYAVAIALPVLAINFVIPNNLRGLSMGSYVVLVAIAGGVSAPLVGWTSQLLGGEHMLGVAMALSGVGFSALTALCFAVAARGAAKMETA